MKIMSFARVGFQLKPIEVEVSFVPGVPKITYLGQPDTLIKESELKIKSALKHQGFQFPKGQQVIVNLKPSYIKKTSQGVDLAIALAILLHTSQVDIEGIKTDPFYVYGTLDLHGRVDIPDDIESLMLPWSHRILTGHPKKPQPLDLFCIEDLNGLAEVYSYEANFSESKKVAPSIDENFYLSESAATIMSVVSHGEHSIVLAGPSGSGKTTFAKNLFRVLMPPDESEFRISQQINKILGHKVEWRPFIHPHTSITALAMVGGGSPIFPGEMTRAHSGVLLLDELLEFKNEVKEALREPIESGEISIARRGKSEKLPASFLLIATTNLCPCGDLVPGKLTSCRFSLRKCRSYSERLSGPLLDRFQILTFTQAWSLEEKSFKLSDVKLRVKVARKFATENRNQEKPNGKLSDQECMQMFGKNIDDLNPFLPELSGSYRRKLSLIRVARSLADLEQSMEIKPVHIEAASQIANTSFDKMKQIFN